MQVSNKKEQDRAKRNKNVHFEEKKDIRKCHVGAKSYA